MARTNTKTVTPAPRTHEGAVAARITPEQMLRRSVMANMLWEGEFYEDGQSIADRIRQLVGVVPPAKVLEIAVEAREQQHLRHVPLLLLASVVGRLGGKPVGDTIARVIKRADEPGELLSLYWKLNPTGRKRPDGKPDNAPLAKQLKRGLALAMQKFDAYQLAKYDRAADVRLRDVLFLTHAKPKDEVQADNWKQLVNGTLPAPDTWEVALSSGADKKSTWERLLRENNLGYLALLRNLRNMNEVGVDDTLIRAAILARKGAHNVLPFRFTAAARIVPRFERELDTALQAAIAELPVLSGRTAVLVDVSGSMNSRLSAKSDLTRMDAAATLASIVNADNLRVFSFSNTLKEVPPRRGMAGVDAIIKSQPHGGTELFGAVNWVNAHVPYDRLIVITDEQATGRTDAAGPKPKPGTIGYMINIASYKNGVGYNKWVHIDGFSENVLRFMHEYERSAAE